VEKETVDFLSARWCALSSAALVRHPQRAERKAWQRRIKAKRLVFVGPAIENRFALIFSTRRKNNAAPRGSSSCGKSKPFHSEPKPVAERENRFLFSGW
jgi:hypothetical protein